jgi:hypothetical protein
MLIGLIISIMIIILPNSYETTSATRQSSQNPGLPTVTIELLESSQTAHVGPEENCTVTFNGVVSVTCHPATEVTVSLTAEDTWGTAAVSPSTLMFSESGNQSFITNVRARPRESTSNTGTVTVLGRWEMTPGSFAGPADPQQGAVGRIDIAQFYKFTLSSSEPYKEISPNENDEFLLTVQNKGNGQDTFSIEIENKDELSSRDYHVSLSQISVEILENPAEENIRINIDTPSDISGKTYQSIRVEVTSDNGIDEGLPSQTFNFSLKLTKNPKNDPSPNDLDPDLDPYPDPDSDKDVSQNIEELQDWLFTATNLIYFMIFLIIVVMVIILLGWQMRRKNRNKRDYYD